MTATSLPPERFDRNAREALQDPQLRGALRKAASLFGERRAAAVAARPDWEELREKARRVKDETLRDLDRYLAQFIANAEAAGAAIHRAKDAAEACRIVAELAARCGARRLVKSKSMTTEEIRLNEALLRDGREPVETDLGEWIVQLAGETPSHIIVPAIHKTKEQIAELFVEKLAIPPGGGAEELTRAARAILRRHFAAADFGISGVNFAVAETGSLLILENEGNVRMTTSLPRIHLAVMGLEKVIPRFADLAVFLRLLPRSGTGQHLTSYQSILTGPKLRPEDEGPEQLHVLILDNGRSAMLKEAVTRQALACIRCGACLNACPVYQQIGGHAYGSVYPGPIGAIITPQLMDWHKASQLPFASSLCGACRDVCPVKIDIPELLLYLRSRIAEGRGLPGKPETAAHPLRPGEKRLFAVWAWLMTSPRRYRGAARLLRLVPWLWRRAPPARAWAAARELRPPARRSFRELWREQP